MRGLSRTYIRSAEQSPYDCRTGTNISWQQATQAAVSHLESCFIPRRARVLCVTVFECALGRKKELREWLVNETDDQIKRQLRSAVRMKLKN
jgi:hypothetical protein